MKKALLFILLMPAAANAAAAQEPTVFKEGPYPLPAPFPVPCYTCSRDFKKPTVPYSGFIKKFTGRFVDSNLARDCQQNVRTFRAAVTRFAPEHDKVFMILGSMMNGYNLSTFFSQTLPARKMSGNSSNNCGQGALDLHIRADREFYAERVGSGWKTGVVDGQDRLFDFSYDDRGFIYVATGVFGWGILDKNLYSIVQMLDQPGGAVRIASLKSTKRYYALAGDEFGPNTAIYDVTDPARPAYLRMSAYPLNSYDKNKSGDRFAIAGKKAFIFDTAAFIAGQPPLAEFLPAAKGASFLQITGDGANFYAVEGGNGSKGLSISMFTAAGDSYIQKRFEFGGAFLSQGIRYGAGFITVWGYGPDNKSDVRLFKVENASLVPVELNKYFQSYYTGGAPAGYASPNGYTNGIRDVVTYRHSDGKLYLVYSNHGLGDVYELGISTVGGIPGGSGPAPVPAPSPAPGPAPTPGPNPTPPTTSCTQPRELQIIIQCAGVTCRPNEPVRFVPNDYYQLGRFAGNCADSFSWSFGDGGSSTEKFPQHAYASNQNQTVRLTVNPESGSRVSASNTVILGGSPSGPIPVPTPTPPAAGCPQPRELQIIIQCVNGACRPNEPVRFVPHDYYKLGRFAGACADSFSWSFGDGGSSKERSPQHTYASNQNQTVSLTVNPQGGPQVSASNTVILGGGNADAPSPVDDGPAVRRPRSDRGDGKGSGSGGSGGAGQRRGVRRGLGAPVSENSADARTTGSGQPRLRADIGRDEENDERSGILTKRRSGVRGSAFRCGPDTSLPARVYGPGMSVGRLQPLERSLAPAYEALAKSLGMDSGSPCVSAGLGLAHVANRRLPEIGALCGRSEWSAPQLAFSSQGPAAVEAVVALCESSALIGECPACGSGK